MQQTIAVQPQSPKWRTGRPVRTAIVILLIGQLVLLFVPAAASRSNGAANKLVMERLVEAPLWQLMPVSGRSTDSMIESLSEMGAADANSRSSIRSLSGNDPEREAQLLGAVFSYE